MNTPKLRIARPTNDLQKISEMYKSGLGMTLLAAFENHEGYDGVILGHPKAEYHLELTFERGVQAPRCASEEILMVLYLPDAMDWQASVIRMERAGFRSVRSRNPYWDANGKTFEDPEGYRIVLSKQNWSL